MSEPSKRLPIEPHQKLMMRLQLLSMEEKRSRAAQEKAGFDLKRYSKALEELACASGAPLESIEVIAPNGSEPWIWPSLRTLRAWANWNAQSKADRFPPEFSSKGSRPRIAFLLGGGVGDILKATTLLQAIKHHFDGEIHAFIDNPVAREILRDNPDVTTVTIISRNPYDFSKNVLENLPLFDLIITWRYVVNYILPPGSRLDSPTVRDLIARSDQVSRPFRIYYAYNDVWPTFNNGLGRDMIENGWKVLDIAGATSDLGINRDHPIPFTPSEKSLSIVEVHRSRPYVTVHHGYDLNNLPSKTINTAYGSTKNLSTAFWARILDGVNDLGLDIIQLGATSEEALPGARYVYNGQTSLSETAMLIKNAVCHIDTEGGLVHLARAVHTRSVVLFGPTPVDVFGYSQNLNFEPAGCNACWYSTASWIVQCPRETAGPDCMTDHRSIDVVAAVGELLADYNSLTFDLLDPAINTRRQSPLDALYAMMPVRGRRILIVADGDCSAIGRRLMDDGAEIEIALSSIQATEALSDAWSSVARVVASPYNLPNESQSFDSVIVYSQALWGAYGGLALRESLRVVRAGGVLLGVSPEVAGRPDLQSIFEDANLPSSKWIAARCDEAGHFLIGVRRTGSVQGAVSAKSARTTPETQQAGKAMLDANRFIERLDADIQAAKDRIRANLTVVHDLVSRREAIDQDIWAAKDVVGRIKSGPEGWIHFSLGKAAPDIVAMLDENWSGLEPWGVWGIGSRHSILLPLPEELKHGQYVEVELLFTLLPSNDGGPRLVTISSGRSEIYRIICTEGETTAIFVVPRKSFLAGQAAMLEFDIGYPVVPSAIWPHSTDDRPLGLGLVRLRYRVISHGRP